MNTKDLIEICEKEKRDAYARGFCVGYLNQRALWMGYDGVLYDEYMRGLEDGESARKEKKA